MGIINPAYAALRGNDGWIRLPNGMILQWVRGGAVDVAQPSSGTLNWPRAFPNACLLATVNMEGSDLNYAAVVSGRSTTTVSWAAREWGAGAFTGAPVAFGIGW